MNSAEQQVLKKAPTTTRRSLIATVGVTMLVFACLFATIAVKRSMPSEGMTSKLLTKQYIGNNPNFFVGSMEQVQKWGGNKQEACTTYKYVRPSDGTLCSGTGDLDDECTTADDAFCAATMDCSAVADYVAGMGGECDGETSLAYLNMLSGAFGEVDCDAHTCISVCTSGLPSYYCADSPFVSWEVFATMYFDDDDFAFFYAPTWWTWTTSDFWSLDYYWTSATSSGEVIGWSAWVPVGSSVWEPVFVWGKGFYVYTWDYTTTAIDSYVTTYVSTYGNTVTSTFYSYTYIKTSYWDTWTDVTYTSWLSWLSLI